ncbi:hypothetical protein DFH06DRAFT_1372245 [Mycena polygramma]|nr:hypothetical protein DFH06DRAFT_1372245 [Mycena polygramma]
MVGFDYSVSSPNVAEGYYCKRWVASVGWLAQANRIFDRLNITRDLENYVCVDTIDYWLSFSASTGNLPPGYLFLCPAADLQDDFACFRIPVYPAYWSLEPSGAERLTADEAGALGFPDIQCVREFHEAKGLDPHSQEAAIAMGCPLFEMTCDHDRLFAHLKANGAHEESCESDVEEYQDFPEDPGEDQPGSTPVGTEIESVLPSDDGLT